MSLVEKIKSLAQEKKITIAELERKTNISNGQIRKWDTVTPGIDKVKLVADFFDISVDELLSDEAPSDKTSPELLERVKILISEKKMTVAELERALNFGQGSISRWSKSAPSADKIQKVADYFDVSTDYLLGRTDKRCYYDLTDKEKKDIAIQAEELLNGLDSKAETNYYGEPLDEEDKQKLHEAIELALALTKVKAKKKFTPKKYRDENSNK